MFGLINLFLHSGEIAIQDSVLNTNPKQGALALSYIMSSVKNIHMSKDHADPFFAFKDKCTGKLDTLTIRMKRWNTSFNTPNNTSLRKDTEKVQQTLDRLKQYVGDLEKMVKVVEKAPSKFPHIDAQELSNRRSFVNTAKAKIATAQSTIKSPAVKEKMLQQARTKGGLFYGDNGNISNSLGSNKKGGYNSLNSPNNSNSNSSNSNSRFMNNQKEEQARIFKEQDEVLDDMDEGLMRIGGMAESISTELDAQNKSLKEFNDEVEEAQAKMNFLMRGMSKLLKTTNNGFLCMILFLTITFCIMLFIYVNTGD